MKTMRGGAGGFEHSTILQSRFETFSTANNENLVEFIKINLKYLLHSSTLSPQPSPLDIRKMLFHSSNCTI
jgi:hypothetical protein